MNLPRKAGKGANMATVKDEVMKRIKIEEGRVISNLSPEESVAAKNTLDQEADLVSAADNEWDDYDPETAVGDTKDSDTSEDLDSLITHCDAYRFGDKTFPVIVTKNLTDVLSHMKDGSYTIATFECNYKKTAALSIESSDKNIEREVLDMPRGKKGVKVEDGLVIVELNSINGFKISVLYEEVSDYNHKMIMQLLDSVKHLQGNLLGRSLQFLNSISHDMTVSNQAASGLAKQGRKAFISKKLDKVEAEGGKRVITKEIQNESANVANQINEKLGVRPLTDYSLQTGIRLQRITRTSTEPKDWESRRGSVTYKKTKSGYIKIERITDNITTVPMLASSNEYAVSNIEKIAQCFITIAEYIARDSMGISVSDDLGPIIVPPIVSEFSNQTVSKVLGMESAEFLKVAAGKADIAQKVIDEYFKDDQIRQVTSLLNSLSSAHRDN